MNWLYWAAYGVSALVFARIFYSYAFDWDYKDSIKQGVESEEKRLEIAREYGLGWSLAAIIWPVVLVVGGAIYLITMPTPTEKRLAAEKKEREFQQSVEDEMVRLREWHEENKFDAPDTATLRFMAENNLRKEKK